MRIDWSKRALRELEAIADYIEADSPQAAERVVARIVEQITSLSTMPNRGTPGRVHGTREMFFLPWPYFVIYRVVGDNVRIMRIRHAARRWPPS